MKWNDRNCNADKEILQEKDPDYDFPSQEQYAPYRHSKEASACIGPDNSGVEKECSQQ